MTSTLAVWIRFRLIRCRLRRIKVIQVSRVVVPFDRVVELGSRGTDVRAIKRGLARAKIGHLGGITPLFGPFAVKNLKTFQSRAGLQVTGRYDRATHLKLAVFFDSYATFLYNKAPTAAQTAEANARARIVAAALALYQVASHVHYTQGSQRMMIVRDKLRPPFEGVEIYEDCSSSSTGCYWVANLPDPNGLNYNGEGFTGTLSAHGKIVSLAQAKPGDLVFYGLRSPWEHVAIYLGNGRVWSFGSEQGPLILPINYRADFGQIRSYF